MPILCIFDTLKPAKLIQKSLFASWHLFEPASELVPFPTGFSYDCTFFYQNEDTHSDGHHAEICHRAILAFAEDFKSRRRAHIPNAGTSTPRR